MRFTKQDIERYIEEKQIEEEKIFQECREKYFSLIFKCLGLSEKENIIDLFQATEYISYSMKNKRYAILNIQVDSLVLYISTTLNAGTTHTKAMTNKIYMRWSDEETYKSTTSLGFIMKSLVENSTVVATQPFLNLAEKIPINFKNVHKESFDYWLKALNKQLDGE